MLEVVFIGAPALRPRYEDGRVPPLNWKRGEVKPPLSIASFLGSQFPLNRSPVVLMSLATSAQRGSDNSEEALLAELQRRLTPAGGGKEPKRDLVAAALALARDPTLRPREAYEQHRVPLGGDRSRVNS